MSQRIFGNTVVKYGIMGNHQLVGIKEGLDVIPDLRENRGVSNIAFMNAMNLYVAPEKRRLGIN